MNDWRLVVELLEKRVTELEAGFTEAVVFRKHFAIPSRIFEGMLVYADGISWDPGSGEGFYRYDGSSWNFLG